MLYRFCTMTPQSLFVSYFFLKSSLYTSLGPQGNVRIKIREWIVRSVKLPGGHTSLSHALNKPNYNCMVHVLYHLVLIPATHPYKNLLSTPKYPQMPVHNPYRTLYPPPISRHTRVYPCLGTVCPDTLPLKPSILWSFPKIRGPQCRPQNTMILTIGTPKRVP